MQQNLEVTLSKFTDLQTRYEAEPKQRDATRDKLVNRFAEQVSKFNRLRAITSQVGSPTRPRGPKVSRHQRSQDGNKRTPKNSHNCRMRNLQRVDDGGEELKSWHTYKEPLIRTKRGRRGGRKVQLQRALQFLLNTFFWECTEGDEQRQRTNGCSERCLSVCVLHVVSGEIQCLFEF